MANLAGVEPTAEQYRLLADKYGFQPKDDVLPAEGVDISLHPEAKVGICVKTFDVGYRLPISDFTDEVLRRNGVGIYQLTPNGVNKNVAFELYVVLWRFLNLELAEALARSMVVGELFASWWRVPSL
ncbi:hypothetical protein L1887_16899 [Cichorium endivia]|nr:hypothetical protein L1887_16899 [Cichorium endivia]